MNKHASYQDLRSHLAYLKLAAARRAAPGRARAGREGQARLHAVPARPAPGRGRRHRATPPRRPDAVRRVPIDQDAGGVRLHRPARHRPCARQRARDPAVRRGEGQPTADRAAGRWQDDARDRARAQSRAGRLPRALHNRRRPRRPHQPRRRPRTLGEHDAILGRTAGPHRRRTRISPDGRRSRQPPVPGHHPPLPPRHRDPDHQPRDRRVGPRSSKTPPSPSRSSTDSSTTRPSFRSTATATACAATAPSSPSSAPA